MALDAADVVIMKSRLTDGVAAIRLSRGTIRNIHQNLFWAFFYNALCIPLAMGVYGISLRPEIGAAAMACSSFFVCTNALRLNKFKLYDGSKDRPLKKKAQEEGPAQQPLLINDEIETKEDTMEKTMNIEGMMCIHCQGTVQKTLESLPGVAEAKVSHEQGTAVVRLAEEVADEVLKAAVEEKGYQVKAIL